MVTEKGKEECCTGGAPETEANAAEACCAHGAPAAEPGGAQEAFQKFMATALAPGALDAAQKELMTIALSVAVRCRPCLEIHLEKARGMGISGKKIEEAAWTGVIFGGCKSMMFWQGRS